MPSPDLIPLQFRAPRRWSVFLGLTAGGIVLFHLLTLQRGGGGEFGALLAGDWLGYGRRLLGYYLLFELVSVALFVRGAQLYQRWVQPAALAPTLGAVVRYQLRFLPYTLLAPVLFGPVTNGLRYLAVQYPDYSWAEYFPTYFFTLSMWGNYLLPFLLFGYALLNVNLFLSYHAWQQCPAEVAPAAPEAAAASAPTYVQHLPAWDDEGETLLPVREVLYVEVERKAYYAHTLGRTYQLRQTLAELEARLDPRQFYRLNRSVLANVAHVKNFAYWENDKYVVRLTDGKTEFVVQRVRLRGLKERLAELAELVG